MTNKKPPFYIWILLTVVVVGIFLRTYNFHDWLRFSSDQSRDALLIYNVLEGKEMWPLLGPVAGGTFFHLGPAYYYFSAISAKIFGSYPDSLAYPSLLFSILSIPLMFLFLREYFSRNISLALTAIMGLSYYFIKEARFSSNPNLIPFFTLLFLFSFLRLIRSKKEKSFLWIIPLGISVGIGVQLHTTLLVLMPIFTFLIFMLYDHKRILSLKQLLWVVAIALTLNIPQFIDEYRTGGENMAHFFDALVVDEQKTALEGKKDESFFKKIGTTFVCQAKANLNMVSNLPVEEKCSKGIDVDVKSGSKEVFGDIDDKKLRRQIYLFEIIIIGIFFILGYSLFIYKSLKEGWVGNDFLILIFLYNLCSLFFLAPVVNNLTIGYFNVIFFVPFIFLGLLAKMFIEKFRIYGKVFSVAMSGAIFMTFVCFNIETYNYFKAGSDNNLENSNLKWAEEAGDFLGQNGNFQEGVVYLSGESKYLNRYFGPISYMLRHQGHEAVEASAGQIEKTIPEGVSFIYIKNETKGALEENINSYETLDSARISPVDIYILIK